MPSSVKNDNGFMKKEISLLVLAIVLLALASCKSSHKSEESVSNINNTLQDSVEAILERHLVELWCHGWGGYCHGNGIGEDSCHGWIGG